MQGFVSMVHDNPGWKVRDPWGTKINTATSKCQGLDTAIMYAHEGGFPLKVFGGSQFGHGDSGRITCQEPIHIPAGAKGNYELIGVTLYFPNAWDSQGLIFDSMDMLYFSLTGQIVYPGNDAAVKISPRSDFYEGDYKYRAWTSSRVYIQTIAIVDLHTWQPTHEYGTGLVVDPCAPVTFNTVEVDEINGGVTPFWVAPASSGGYYDPAINKMAISFPH
jgi:hypothetical protein